MSSLLTPGRPAASRIRLVPWSEIDKAYGVDYHMHTSFTDGTADIHQMADAAVLSGLREILLSEHVRHTSTYYPSFAGQVGALSYAGLRAFAGVEAKVVDVDGRLDCSPETASLCDAIIGSVHSPPQGNGGKHVDWSQLDADEAVELEFQLAWAIVTKSRAHVLGHPMGMVIMRRGLRPIDHLYQLAQACCEYDRAFELNTRYCPDAEQWIEIVKRAECKVSVGSDAHQPEAVGSAWRRFVDKETSGL
jgi:histidinol phosphatase-like PHP family hydrolase